MRLKDAPIGAKVIIKYNNEDKVVSIGKDCGRSSIPRSCCIDVFDPITGKYYSRLDARAECRPAWNRIK